MITEALIIFSCAGGYECSKTPQAYYLSKPQLRSWVKEVKDTYKEKTKDNPTLQIAIPTVLGSVFLMQGGKPRIRITKHLSVRISKEETDLTLTYVF